MNNGKLSDGDEDDEGVEEDKVDADDTLLWL